MTHLNSQNYTKQSKIAFFKSCLTLLGLNVEVAERNRFLNMDNLRNRVLTSMTFNNQSSQIAVENTLIFESL